MEILMIALPILWFILAIAQFYNTRLQFKIGMYEYRKMDDKELLVDTTQNSSDAVDIESAEPVESDSTSSNESNKADTEEKGLIPSKVLPRQSSLSASAA